MSYGDDLFIRKVVLEMPDAVLMQQFECTFATIKLVIERGEKVKRQHARLLECILQNKPNLVPRIRHELRILDVALHVYFDLLIANDFAIQLRRPPRFLTAV
jgi:hypothetical protein